MSTQKIYTVIILPESNSRNIIIQLIGAPQNGWFIMENPIKMGDLGVPLFLETPTD